MARIPKLFRMNGGLNVEDPMYVLPPGSAVVAQNYEARVGGGYERVDGYERFDGHAATPSAAVYDWLSFTGGGLSVPASGSLIVGFTSGANAYVAGTPELSSGDWSSNNAAGKMGLTAHNGTPFQVGEAMQVSGITVCTCASTVTAAAIDDVSRKSWLAGARDYYRSLISAVPGQGRILGVVMYKNDVYAIRNAVGGATAVIHKATTSGWAAQTLSTYLRFDTGTVAIGEGEVIVGVSSGHTATVTRVNIAAGNYAGPTYASGRFGVTGATGVFTAGEDLKVGGVKRAQAVGTATVATLAPDGHFEFRNWNFYGGSNTLRIYGVDGVNRAWEYDGTTFCFIETGMASDVPTHLECHRNNLFLGFAGGSLQNSSTGAPLTWSVRTGAGEIGVGADITNIFQNGANTLLITSRTSLSLLYGTSDLDWNLKAMAGGSLGSVPLTCAEVGGTTVFTDSGSTNVLAATNAYGDYSPKPFSRSVRKILESSDAATAKFAIGCTLKGQYRLFFADKTMLECTFSGASPQAFMRSTYPDQFVCGVADKNTSNIEAIYCGTDDGFVMKMDTGTSFDGDAIESVLQVPYGYFGVPDRDKRYRKLTLEMETPAAVDIRILTDFSYGAGGLSTTGLVTSTPATGGFWDFASWNQFFWDSSVVSSPELNIDGVGKNISITFYHKDAVDAPFTIQATMLQYDVWGIKY